MFVDLLASISFFGLPYLLGRIFTNKNIYAFFIGLLGWYGLYSIFSFIDTWISFRYLVTFAALSTVLVGLLKISTEIINDKKFGIRHFSIQNFPYLIILITSLFTYFFVWKLYTPYPLQLDWDIYEHITLANIISKGNMTLLPSYLSDTFTFNGYTTLFQTILSLPKTLFNTNLIGVYWWMEYWHYLLTMSVVYVFTKKIFKKTEIALFTSLISGFIFESSIVYSNLFLIPQTLTSLLAIFLLNEIYDERESRSITRKLFFILSLLALFFMHFVLGSAAIVILLSYKILHLEVFKKNLNKLIITALGILAIVISTHLFGNLDLTGREEASYFNMNLTQIASIFSDWFGLSLIFLVPGIYGILKMHEQGPKKILLLSLLATTVSLAPLAYFLKYYTLARYGIIIVLGFGVFYLIRSLNSKVRYLLQIWVLLVFSIIFYLNIGKYQNFLIYSEEFSHISENEIKTANWIAKNYNPSTTFLLSDPATQYIMEAISEVNTQGGAYMSANTRNRLISINDSLRPENVREKVIAVNDKLEGATINKRLFVVGGRYFDWQRMDDKQKASFYYNIWSPKLVNDKDIPFLNMLSSDPNFKVVYQNRELVVFEVQ